MIFSPSFKEEVFKMSNVACIQKAIAANPYRAGSITIMGSRLNMTYNYSGNMTNPDGTLINSRLSNRWSGLQTYYTA